MPKQRISIPKATRETVLLEFNHRCAVCGSDRPQIHHIDENPANNDMQNLLPLCPNCHLVDNHNPTSSVDPSKLALFRRYKDPVVLSPHFHPLFTRFKYLLDIGTGTSWDSLHHATVELIAFINVLNMGAFYHRQVDELLIDHSPSMGFSDEPETILQERMLRREEQYRAQIIKNREKAIELIIEMLRYQDWPSIGKRFRGES